MSASERELRTSLGSSEDIPVDGFVLVVTVAICIVWAIAGLPAFARDPGEPNIPLLVVVAVPAVLAAMQWLTHLRKFGFDPPLIPGLGGVILTLALTPWHGQLGAVIGLSAALIASYVWRIAEDSPTRFADATYSVSAVALLGFLPAQVLLLRELPGTAGFYFLILGTLAFGVVQAILQRPSRDGTREFGVSTAGAALAAWLVVIIASVIRGEPYGFVNGVLVGISIGAACAVGRVMLPILVPIPSREGKKLRRRPMMIDAFLPIAVAAAGAFFSVRGILAT